MIPIWKHIFSSQNKWKESEQSMKNIWTYNTLKTNHSGWVQLAEMGEWCIKICVLQTIFYNVAWYGVTLTKHICLNAGTKNQCGSIAIISCGNAHICAMLYSHNSLRHDRNLSTSKYLVILVPLYRACDHFHSRSNKETVGWSRSRVCTNHNLDASCIIVESVWHEANANYKKQLPGHTHRRSVSHGQRSSIP